MNIFPYNKNSWIILRRTEYSLILRILDKRKKKQQILKKPCSELPLQKQTPDRSFLITISILNHSPKPTQTSNFFHYTDSNFSFEMNVKRISLYRLIIISKCLRFSLSLSFDNAYLQVQEDWTRSNKRVSKVTSN